MSQRGTLPIKACVLSLASNTNQAYYLENAKNWLASYGKLTLSSINTNQDKNSDGKIADSSQKVVLFYFNQVAYLAFNQPIDYWLWVQLTKEFENQQDRDKCDKPQVTLDIDIVAIQLVENFNCENVEDEKGNQFLILTKLENPWLGISRRFPLASYDQQGIEDLSNQLDLSFLTNH